MTVLFTQVWLWSLAAFLLGAVATWLLFVLPLQRRLRNVRPEPAEGDGSALPPSEWVSQEPWEGNGLSSPDHERTAWDVRPVGDRSTSEFTSARTPQAEPSPDAAPEPAPESLPEPEPSSDRPFRSQDLSGYWSLRRGAPGGSEPSDAAARGGAGEPLGSNDDSAVADTEIHSRVEATATDGTATDGTATDGEPADRAGDRAEGSQSGGVAPASDGAGEPTQRRKDWLQTVRRTPQSASAEPEQRTTTELSGADGNTWFHNERVADHEHGAAPMRPQDGDGDEGQSLSGQLRSLFEPLEASGTAHDRAVTEPPVDGGQSAAPPPAAATTGTAREVGDDTDDAAHNPLPRRVPGATSRPGTPPANRPTGAESAAGQRGEAATRWPSAEEAAGTAAPSSPEEWYPDEAQPPTAPPDEGYAVKGHFASRQYHTTESPHFERVAAEVWFRSAADAEQAGFEPWDGRPRG